MTAIVAPGAAAVIFSSEPFQVPVSVTEPGCVCVEPAEYVCTPGCAPI